MQLRNRPEAHTRVDNSTGDDKVYKSESVKLDIGGKDAPEGEWAGVVMVPMRFVPKFSKIQGTYGPSMVLEGFGLPEGDPLIIFVDPDINKDGSYKRNFAGGLAESLGEKMSEEEFDELVDRLNSETGKDYDWDYHAWDSIGGPLRLRNKYIGVPMTIGKLAVKTSKGIHMHVVTIDPPVDAEGKRVDYDPIVIDNLIESYIREMWTPVTTSRDRHQPATKDSEKPEGASSSSPKAAKAPRASKAASAPAPAPKPDKARFPWEKNAGMTPEPVSSADMAEEQEKDFNAKSDRRNYAQEMQKKPTQTAYERACAEVYGKSAKDPADSDEVEQEFSGHVSGDVASVLRGSNNGRNMFMRDETVEEEKVLSRVNADFDRQVKRTTKQPEKKEIDGQELWGFIDIAYEPGMAADKLVMQVVQEYDVTPEDAREYVKEYLSIKEKANAPKAAKPVAQASQPKEDPMITEAKACLKEGMSVPQAFDAIGKKFPESTKEDRKNAMRKVGLIRV